MTETAIRPEAILAAPYDPSRPAGAIFDLDLVVSPLLPMTPSPGEDARRIVRHGYAAARASTGRAAYFPDSLGDVGPRPGEPTRALQVGRMLLVDRELAQQIDEEHRLEGRRNRERQAYEARQRAHVRAELADIARVLHVPRVVAYRIEHRFDETLFRIPRGELDDQVLAEAWISDEDLHRAGVHNRRLVIANRLRAALADAKLDDEEAGRGR